MVDVRKKKIKVKVKIKDLQPAQWKIVNDILMTDVYYTKYFAIKASRQAGKTFMLERIGYVLAFDDRDLTGCFIMATNKQTKKVFRSMLKWIPKKTILKTNNTDASRYIEFTNGTIMHFFSSNAYDSVAGESFDFRLFAVNSECVFLVFVPFGKQLIKIFSILYHLCRNLIGFPDSHVIQS